jgi:tRNA A37 threonylcarbamoyladenosine synthetase subunit TsaC/SUA5/YrdC
VYNPTEDVVGIIASYMNENQAEALDDIAGAHGFTTANAKIIDLTNTELVLRVSDAADADTARITWPAPLTRREDIRSHLLEMQEAARWS